MKDCSTCIADLSWSLMHTPRCATYRELKAKLMALRPKPLNEVA
jgi:hypothetical protein